MSVQWDSSLEQITPFYCSYCPIEAINTKVSKYYFYSKIFICFTHNCTCVSEFILLPMKQWKLSLFMASCLLTFEIKEYLCSWFKETQIMESSWKFELQYEFYDLFINEAIRTSKCFRKRSSSTTTEIMMSPNNT